MPLPHMIIYGRVNKINKMLGNSTCYAFLKIFRNAPNMVNVNGHETVARFLLVS